MKYSFNRDLELFGLCDIHVGSRDFDRKAFLKIIDTIKSNKSARWFIDGDCIDNITPSKINPYDQYSTPAEQLEELIELLEPIKSQGLFVIDGNHAQRSKKQAYFDILTGLSKRLNINYLGVGGIVTLKVGDITYKIAVQHGSRGGGNPESELDKMAKVYEADAYLLGHSHDLFARPKAKIYMKGSKEVMEMIYYIRTGSFLKYAKYARESMYNPKLQGCVSLTFNPKQKVITPKEFIFINSKLIGG